MLRLSALLVSVYAMTSVFAAQEIQTTETPLVEEKESRLGYGGKAGLMWSPDHEHYLLLYDKGVIIDGVKEGPYPQTPSGLHFTPDSRHYFYSVDHDLRTPTSPDTLYLDGKPFCIERELKLFSPYIMPDGSICCGWQIKQPTYTFIQLLQNVNGTQTLIQDEVGETFKSVVMTQDGKHMAYKWDDCIFHDGKRGRQYKQSNALSLPRIIGNSVVISGDGKHVAYVVRMSSTEEVVRVDEEEHPPLVRIQMPIVFNEDGSLVAYVSYIAKDDYVTYENGKAVSPHYNSIYNLRVNSTGKHCDFMATRNHKDQLVVTDGREQVYERINSALITSPDGRHAAFMATRNGKSVAVIDGKETKEYRIIQDFTFSPNGSHWAFKTERDLVTDQMEVSNFTSSNNAKFTFSADGQHFLAFGGGMNGSQLIVDKNVQTVNYFSADGLTLTPDGKHYALVGSFHDATYYKAVVVDGVVGPHVFDVFGDVTQRTPSAIQLPDVKFSPDGKHFAYFAVVTMTPDSYSRLLIDNHPVGPECKDALASTNFTGPDSLRAIVSDKKNVLQIDAVIPDSK